MVDADAVGKLDRLHELIGESEPDSVVTGLTDRLVEQQRALGDGKHEVDALVVASILDEHADSRATQLLQALVYFADPIQDAGLGLDRRIEAHDVDARTRRAVCGREDAMCGVFEQGLEDIVPLGERRLWHGALPTG